MKSQSSDAISSPFAISLANNMFRSSFKLPADIQDYDRSCSADNQLFMKSVDNIDQSFQMLFSHKDLTESLTKQNEELEIECSLESDPEVGYIYQRRKQKVKKLNSKQKEQQNMFAELKISDLPKYTALSYFMNIFGSIRNATKAIRFDYYSFKCFEALNQSSEQCLSKCTQIIQRMFNEVMNLPQWQPDMVKQGIDDRLVQFLIIPRFLISKQKIARFANDETIQNCFKLLVYFCCLGHYNNSANKKLPEIENTKHLIALAKTPDGRQKVKSICSINHGGYFIKKFNKQEYYQLFHKNLSQLKHIEKGLKKKVKYDKLIAQIDGMREPTDADHIKELEEYLEGQLTLQELQKTHIQKFRQGIKADQMLSISDFISSEMKCSDLPQLKTGNSSKTVDAQIRVRTFKSMPMEPNSTFSHYKKQSTLSVELLVPPLDNVIEELSSQNPQSKGSNNQPGNQ